MYSFGHTRRSPSIALSLTRRVSGRRSLISDRQSAGEEILVFGEASTRKRHDEHNIASGEHRAVMW